MKHDFGIYARAAEFTLDALMNQIDSAVKLRKEFLPYREHFAKLGGSTKEAFTVLDFGCGLGRNTVGIAAYGNKWQVTGYDCAEMLLRAREFYGKEMNNERITLESDWEKLQSKRFDAIYCALTLQQIKEEELLAYLADFARMTDRLVVFSRRLTDEFKNVWEMVERYFEIDYAPGDFSVKGKWDDHSLAVFKIRKVKKAHG